MEKGNLRIRKAVLSDANGIAKVHIDCWRTTYTTMIPNDYINKLTYEERRTLWERIIPNGNAFVAEDESGQIIGFADGGKERTGEYKEYIGEIYAIYVLKRHQGRGIGKRLVMAVVNELLKRGASSMIIWVLQENISCGFYEKMGGTAVDSKNVNFSGKVLIEIAYGWKDIRFLK